MSRSIIFYETSHGTCPVQEFLDELDDSVIKKVFFVLNIIEELEIVPIKFLKKLSGTQDIWEVRVEYKSDIFRLFCFMEKGSLVILTNGYQKKSQKTDRNQIDLAEKYKKDYLSRRIK